MKSAKSKLTVFLLLALACIFISSLVWGAITYELNPANLFRTTGSSVDFEWRVNTTSSIVNPMPSYLFITNQSNESQFILNYTLYYCVNGSSCNVTIGDFLPGYYSWYVVTGESALAPTVTSTNAYPYDTSDRSANITGTVAETYDTRDRAANITSSNAESYDTQDRAATLTSTAGGTTYNLSEGNSSLNITYYNGSSGGSEDCDVEFEKNEALPVANVTASINSACNLTASGTGNFTLTTEDAVAESFIYIRDGNSTVTLGLTNLTNYTGSFNNTLNFRYTNATTTEICNISLPKVSGLATSDVVANITDNCNISAFDVTYVNMNTEATGAAEFIYFDQSSASSILGFSEYTNYSGSVNNSLNFRYTNDSLGTEICNATLTKNATLLALDAVLDIVDECNLTGTDRSSYVNLNTNSTGERAFIYFDQSNAAGLLGFTIGTNYTGSYNNTLNLTYSVNGSEESVVVNLSKSTQLNATDLIGNITQAAYSLNLTMTNNSYVIFNGTGYGSKEYMSFNLGGTAAEILGLTENLTTYGSQTNITSDSYWIEVIDSGEIYSTNATNTKWYNESYFVAMELDKDTGDLWLAGTIDANLSWNNLSSYPSACPGTSAVTTIGDTITCTDSWVNDGENITDLETINLTERSAAPGVASVGMIYYDSDLNELCFYNSTDWIGVITQGACS